MPAARAKPLSMEPWRRPMRRPSKHPTRILVLRRGRQTRVSLRDLAAGEAQGGGDGVVRAPMHGKVLAIFVEKGDKVVRGQRLAIIEAMKMEHTLTAPVDGEVPRSPPQPLSQVAEGAKIVAIATA